VDFEDVSFLRSGWDQPLDCTASYSQQQELDWSVAVAAAWVPYPVEPGPYRLVPENSSPVAHLLRQHLYFWQPGQEASLETDTPAASAPAVAVAVAVVAAAAAAAEDDPAAPEIAAAAVTYWDDFPQYHPPEQMLDSYQTAAAAVAAAVHPPAAANVGSIEYSAAVAREFLLPLV